MKKRSESQARWDAIRERLIGLGGRSHRKRHFPKLQQRVEELERFRAFFDQAADLIFVVDERRRTILDANVSACRHLGGRQEALLGRRIEEFIEEAPVGPPAEERPPVSAGTRFALLKRKEAGPLPVELSVSTILLREEPYTVFVARDISGRLEAQRALAESAQRFRATFNQAAVGIGHVAPDGRWLRINRKYCDIVGYTEEEMKALTVGEITHPDDRAISMRNFQLLLEGKIGNYSLEKRYIRKDGSTVWVHLTASTVFDAGGHPRFAVGVVEDITTRKRAEEALRFSEERYRALYRDNPTMIVTLDADFTMFSVNPACASQLGYAADELEGMSVLKLFHEDDRPDVTEQLQNCLRNPNQVYRWQFRKRRKDGEPLWVEEVAQAVYDLSGRLTVLVVCQDITERRRVEEALRESDRMKSEFITTVAHELNTPLTSIRGFSELLLQEKGLTPAERQEFMNYVHEKSVDLSEIVSQILDIARIDSGQGIPLKKVSCRVLELEQMLAPVMEADRGRHRFAVDLRAPQALLFIDKGKIGQVLENLISNARKYSAEGTLIRVAGELSPGEYRLSVIDQGIGMTPEEKSHVFDKFYRAEDSSTETGGIGLGMSIVLGIVEAHGGEIRVESEKGKGTRVQVFLPLET